MSSRSPKALLIRGAGISALSILIPTAAQSQSKPAKNEATAPRTVGGVALPDPNAINKKIQQDYPAELFDDPNYAKKGAELNGATTTQKGAELNGSTTTQPATIPIATSGGNMTAVGSSNYTFVLSTPLMIALVVVVGGLALFPVLHLLLNSKKAITFINSSPLSKLFDKFQKPKILESDEFLHQRNLDQLITIGNQAENIHGEKFGNSEFTTFVKIKSYIHRSIDEYAGLDDILDMLTAAIGAQNSFLTIDGAESRHCSGTQQQLYKLVDSLLAEKLDPNEFTQKVNQKLAELLPQLKTEEGKIALQAYATEIDKIAQTPLGLRLLLLFKRYHFDDFSVLRGVNNTINDLKNEDLLNLDSLLLLVMVKYDIFEKLGPIIGVSDEYNRPETYAKILQYIGLKDKHEDAYGKFQAFLLLMKKWETYCKTVANVRQKYDPQQYRLPKSFATIIPATDLYEKYKDSLPTITSAPSKSTPTTKIAPTVAVQAVETETEKVLATVE
jgi:hypothetical protein